MERKIFYNTLEDAFTAIKIDGRRLKFVSDDIRNNYDLCLSAVRNNGLALQFVPGQLRNNRDIVFSAVEENSYAIHFVSENFQYINDLSKIITYKHPDFFDHSDLLYSKTYQDTSWEENAENDYIMLKELETEANEMKKDLLNEDEEEM